MVAVLVSGPLDSANAWPGWWTGLGVLLLAVGAIVGILGAITLGRSRTIFPQPLQQSRLVRSGIYAYVRHPLYTSLMLMGVGWALFWSSWWTLGIGAGQCGLLVAKALQEEQWLRQKYRDYEAYAARVHRFFPFLI